MLAFKEFAAGQSAENAHLAPEEPNVYRPIMKTKTCAPAERDVSGNFT
jgi:hypothetical protein